MPEIFMGKTIFFIVLTSLLIMVTVSILSLEVKCYQLARVTQDLIILIEFKEPSLIVSFPPVICGSYTELIKDAGASLINTFLKCW